MGSFLRYCIQSVGEKHLVLDTVYYDLRQADHNFVGSKAVLQLEKLEVTIDLATFTCN